MPIHLLKTWSQKQKLNNKRLFLALQRVFRVPARQLKLIWLTCQNTLNVQYRLNFTKNPMGAGRCFLVFKRKMCLLLILSFGFMNTTTQATSLCLAVLCLINAWWNDTSNKKGEIKHANATPTQCSWKLVVEKYCRIEQICKTKPLFGHALLSAEKLTGC